MYDDTFLEHCLYLKHGQDHILVIYKKPSVISRLPEKYREQGNFEQVINYIDLWDI
jgi:hypothetical protein